MLRGYRLRFVDVADAEDEHDGALALLLQPVPKRTFVLDWCEELQTCVPGMDRYRSRVHDLYRLAELDVEDCAELLDISAQIAPIDQYSDVVEVIDCLLHCLIACLPLIVSWDYRTS